MPRLSLVLLCLIWLSSLVAQVLLSTSGHPVSVAGFLWWTAIYTLVALGLWRRAKIGFWYALLVGLLQLLPALLWSAGLPATLYYAPPSWYAIFLWIAFVLGIAFTISVIRYDRPGAAKRNA